MGESHKLLVDDKVEKLRVSYEHTNSSVRMPIVQVVEDK